ncbi:hypothetical protein CVT24_011708 [Panaeolus cyanescens]|uniref:Carboxylic ester hydrolase n=1 Tax=Panaeolus cyanescens TaxID=181874 RepID=A0A409YHB8_9AGAR|nr:hypothetical protein CVT24_011708 [Panaeolus cyanescens]
MELVGLVCLCLLATHACAMPKPPAREPLRSQLDGNKPVVFLDKATVSGTHDGPLSKFLGISFSKPLERFRPSELNDPYHGLIDARSYGPLCPQQKLEPPNSGIQQVNNIMNQAPELHNAQGIEKEDCLSINIIRPAGVVSGRKLSVLVWIHGGAYQIGDTASYDKMGSRLVRRSVSLGSPVIFVSMNYRLSAYGFLGGAQVFQEKSGNLGLRDQRLALRWVNKYIGAFGGDKSKVTLWGQSSGAISTTLQMITNNGNNEGLFRAAILQSGAPLPVGNITKGPNQSFYDLIVSETGCSTSANTLDCLRNLPFSKLKTVVDRTPNFFSYPSLALVWHPSVDNVFLTDNPQSLVPQGKFANVPILSGICDDEGTLFALSSLNVTTEDDFRGYISSVWQPRNTPEELAPLWNFYTSNAADGSPFNTGTQNTLTAQFKRVAAFIGDSIQLGPRRIFLQKASKTQTVWAYLSKKSKSVPGIGSYHGSDLATDSEPGFLDDHLINFVVRLDPNVKMGPRWPSYDSNSPKLFTFPEVGPPTITLDNFRSDSVNYLNNISAAHPLCC